MKPNKVINITIQGIRLNGIKMTEKFSCCECTAQDMCDHADNCEFVKALSKSRNIFIRQRIGHRAMDIYVSAADMAFGRSIVAKTIQKYNQNTL